MNVAIFSMDPGGSTGIAWSIVNPHAKLAADAMRDRMKANSITITGEPMRQAKEIWSLWEAFKMECVKVGLLPPEAVHLVSEEFVLSPMGQASGRQATMPERVMWAFEGYRTGRHDTYRRTKHFSPLILQRPGAAKRYNSQKMLKPVNAWIVGREHERSALAHMYLYTTVLVTQATASRALRRG